MILPEKWRSWPPVKLRVQPLPIAQSFLANMVPCFAPAALAANQSGRKIWPPARSLRCADGGHFVGAWREQRRHLCSWTSCQPRPGSPTCSGTCRRRTCSREFRRHISPMGRHSECGAGLNAGHRLQPDDEPVAAVPGPGLPRLGAHWLLPVGRRVRFPRPTSGRHGVGPLRAERNPLTHPASGGTAVRGR